MLNLYKLVQYWNDGETDHVVAFAVTRAEDKEEARTITMEDDKSDVKEFWSDSSIEMIGWSTGKDQIKEVLIIGEEHHAENY